MFFFAPSPLALDHPLAWTIVFLLVYFKIKIKVNSDHTQGHSKLKTQLGQTIWIDLGARMSFSLCVGVGVGDLSKVGEDLDRRVKKLRCVCLADSIEFES